MGSQTKPSPVGLWAIREHEGLWGWCWHACPPFQERTRLQCFISGVCPRVGSLRQRLEWPMRECSSGITCWGAEEGNGAGDERNMPVETTHLPLVHGALGRTQCPGTASPWRKGLGFFLISYLFIFGHTGSWLLREGFLSLWCTGFSLW